MKGLGHLEQSVWQLGANVWRNTLAIWGKRIRLLGVNLFGNFGRKFVGVLFGEFGKIIRC